jgi:hypothetical protein
LLHGLDGGVKSSVSSAFNCADSTQSTACAIFVTIASALRPPLLPSFVAGRNTLLIGRAFFVPSAGPIATFPGEASHGARGSLSKIAKDAHGLFDERWQEQVWNDHEKHDNKVVQKSVIIQLWSIEYQNTRSKVATANH